MKYGKRLGYQPQAEGDEAVVETVNPEGELSWTLLPDRAQAMVYADTFANYGCVSAIV